MLSLAIYWVCTKARLAVLWRNAEKNRTPAVLRPPLPWGHQCHLSQQALPSTHLRSCFCDFLARCHIQGSWWYSTAHPFPAISRSEDGHLLGPFLQFRTADSLAKPTLCDFGLCRQHGPFPFSLDCFYGLLQTPALSLGVSDSLQELVDTLTN